MLETMRVFITAHPIIAAALSSLWGAVVIDLMTFIKSKSPGDFFGQFNVPVALWRYAQSLVGGFVGTAVVAGGGTVIGLLLVRWAL